jgi:hypothetical protein
MRKVGFVNEEMDIFLLDHCFLYIDFSATNWELYIDFSNGYLVCEKLVQTYQSPQYFSLLSHSLFGVFVSTH